MQLISYSGPFAIIILSALPIFFWIPGANFANLTSILRSLGQISALVGSVLYCINFILSARLRWLEPFFAGLNRIYVIHHLVGAISFILLLLHPIFLIFSYWTISLPAAVSLVTPNLQNLPVLLGILALAVIIFLLFITFFLKINYDSWLSTHRWLGLPLLLALAHSLLASTTFQSNIYIKVYITSMFYLAIISYVYHLVSRIAGINVYRYQVDQVNSLNNVTTIILSPLSRSLKYIPGQFAYLNVNHPGIDKHPHPFTISSSPNNPNISFSIKSLGDYTETIKLLGPGDKVRIEGPFGKFSYKYYSRPKQLWVAGGIGITPFLSMLNSLNNTHKFFITLIYSVKSISEAAFLDQIKTVCLTLPNINFVFWNSSSDGRLTVEDILKITPDIVEHDIFICGPPPMMDAISSGLKKVKVPISRIHTERFSLS